MHHQKLYKKTTTGAIQVWWLELEGDRYRTHSGKNNGAIVTSEWTVATPKNEGRANATTPEVQARLEVQAAYTLKKKGHYYETVSDAMGDDEFSPMLADKYPDRKILVERALGREYVAVQPKLDGIRCIATAEGLFSRKNNEIVGVPHIREALAPLFASNPALILDGELYNHDFSANFPELVSLIKKTKPSEKDLAKSAEVVQYHLYDAPSEDPTDERMAAVADIISILGIADHLPIQWVETREASSQADLDEAHDSFLAAGYEGSMIRLLGSYEQKRSKLLLKRKEWMDEEFEILNIEEGIGNKSGIAAAVIVRLPNGTEGKANVKGNVAYCRKVLMSRSALVGKMVTIEFADYTPEGKLRFGRTKEFHTTERW